MQITSTSQTTDNRTTPRFLRPFSIIRANARAYLILNAASYGLVLLGFALALVFPQLNQAQVDTLESSGDAALVRQLISNPWLFAVVILAVNVGRLGLLRIVLPSLVVPFLGLPLFGYWVITTGAALIPSADLRWAALIPHSLTLVIELQAYILLLLGVYRIGVRWLWPQRFEARNRRQGYFRGLQELGWLSILAVLLLIVGAVWESFSIIYLVHPLSVWLTGN